MARKVNRGLTLVETIVSLLILSLVMIFVLNLFPSSLRAAGRGEQTVQADLIARSAVEEASAQPYDSLQVGVTTLNPVAKGGVTYETELEIFRVSGYDLDHLKGIRATVRWDYGRIRRDTTHELWVADVKR